MGRLTLSEQVALNLLRQEPAGEAAAANGSSPLQRRESGHYAHSARQAAQKQAYGRVQHSLRQLQQRRRLDALQSSSKEMDAAQPAVRREVNDDPSLEREADVMGREALRHQDRGGALASKTASKPVLQRVRIKGADYDNEEIWKEVREELLNQSIPRKLLRKLKERFDKLPEDEVFEFFDEIAHELVSQYNAENHGSLEFALPDEAGQDVPSTGLSGALSKLFAILPWLLMALVVFQLLIPAVGATPVSGNRGRQTEGGELDALEPLPDISPDDQLALTPIAHFRGVEQPPALALPSLFDSLRSVHGGTRIDEGPGHQPAKEEGMSLRDYVIWNIFSSRRNFGELPKVPRQDMSLGDWLVNGPSWLYLPYTKFSPTELAVFIKHFHIKPALEQIPKTLMKSTTGTMHAVARRLGPESNHLAWTFFKKAVLRGGYETLRAYYKLFTQMTDVNAQARSFRSDLSADPWIKNSYRHAYWMCQYARQFGAAFASDLGYAHEYAHLDLTIEGPFDSVLDKINNLWGIKLAEKMEQTCEALINDVGEKGYLAWAKEYEKSEDSGVYLPRLHNIQGPLDELWERYQALPEFNEYDFHALSLLKVQLPGQKKSSVTIEEID
jgi:hypothetical protein